ALELRAVDVVGDAHPKRGSPLRPRLGVIAVEDQHVAAAALGLLQEPADGSSRAGWTDDLEEPIGADRKERVFKSKARDIVVAVTFFHAQQRADECRGCLQMRCGEADLTQA